MQTNIKKVFSLALMFLVAFSLCACSNSTASETTSSILNPVTATILASPTSTPSATKVTATPTSTPKKTSSDKPLSGYVIGIDAGHQLKGNSQKEQNGPGSSVYKDKVTSGATGNDSGIREQLINLQVALKLQSSLEKLGAKVVMTRTSENVNLSNKERAEIFNNAGVDFAIRIHCDSSDTRSAHGISILIPDSKNNASIYSQSKRLADSLIGPLCKSTGAANRGVVQRDDQTGFNWSNVPVVTVEMGFLSNSSEESKLITSSYQYLLVEGYVNGILQYIKD